MSDDDKRFEKVRKHLRYAKEFHSLLSLAEAVDALLSTLSPPAEQGGEPIDPRVLRGALDKIVELTQERDALKAEVKELKSRARWTPPVG